MKPTLEQLKAWTLEAAREYGFDSIENIEEELAGIPGAELMAALFVCNKAAAWARKQALMEAAELCEDRAKRWRFRTVPFEGYAIELNKCAAEILALKEQSHD